MAAAVEKQKTNFTLNVSSSRFVCSLCCALAKGVLMQKLLCRWRSVWIVKEKRCSSSWFLIFWLDLVFGLAGWRKFPKQTKNIHSRWRHWILIVLSCLFAKLWYMYMYMYIFGFSFDNTIQIASWTAEKYPAVYTLQRKDNYSICVIYKYIYVNMFLYNIYAFDAINFGNV